MDGSASATSKDLFDGAGEMRALLRATDWSRTRLGPVEGWPQSLRTMLGVVLGSRFPMLLWWGPDLLHLYNDAYRPILRDKHPASLGAPAAEVWAEVWDVAGPMARSVQEGGPATWTEDLQLFIKSGDMAEETYFTFSYSPVPGDDGSIGGLLNTVQETTAKVQGERQIRMLRDLAGRVAEAKFEDEAYRIAAEVLSGNELDLPFVLFYVVEEDGEHARLAAGSGWAEQAARIRIGDEPTAWRLAEVMRTGQALVLDEIAAGPAPLGRWNARPERAIVLPLFGVGQGRPQAFAIAGISPHRSLDDRYRRFFSVTADQVSALVANAKAYAVEAKRAEALAELDRAKTIFFSNVSHELRTPLTLILGPVEDALAHPERSLSGEGLAAVHRGALRLLKLVNSLLEFARIEAGRMQLDRVPTDLPTLTADLASSFRSLTERAGLRLVVDCPPCPEPAYVDPAQWEKIVLNLVSNAFKFTLTGEIGVELRTGPEEVLLVVRDSGVGIPADELPRIFDRFHRVAGANGRSFEGTGIGLSFVKELVELHGGTVRAFSVEGRGSRFEVSLPTARGSAQVDAVTPPTSSSTATIVAPYLLEASLWMTPMPANDQALPAPSEPFPVTPRVDQVMGRERARVLVVDDNADMRDYLARLLASRWDVCVAEDGQAALDLARERPPDLVLSDVMMPRLDGYSLLRELRAHPRTSHVPVVLLSARVGEEALVQGLESGADDYLAKPFSSRELLARVQTHLEMARLRREWSIELERANSELETFSYSVAHDLRSPLRAIDGFSKALLDQYANELDHNGRHYLERVRAGTQRMGHLIDDLLGLARITRGPLKRERVDLAELAQKVLRELGSRDPVRRVECLLPRELVVEADSRLVHVALENLLGNAWKFTSKQTAARIELGTEDHEGSLVCFVRDNGAGFDMEHAKKLFTPFQRLHSEAEFHGTGVGLATVHRVVARHGGRIWAAASPGEGATFFFTLGVGT